MDSVGRCSIKIATAVENIAGCEIPDLILKEKHNNENMELGITRGGQAIK